MQSLPKFQKKSPYQHCRLQSPKVNTKIPSCVQEVPSCETVGWKLGEYVMELLCWLVFFICPLGKNVAGLTMFLIIWHRKAIGSLSCDTISRVQSPRFKRATKTREGQSLDREGESVLKPVKPVQHLFFLSFISKDRVSQCTVQGIGQKRLAYIYSQKNLLHIKSKHYYIFFDIPFFPLFFSCINLARQLQKKKSGVYNHLCIHYNSYCTFP